MKKNEGSNNVKKEHIFKRGDIICSLDKKDQRLILGTTEDDISYEFIVLKEQRFRDIFSSETIIRKGDLSSQPTDIVERYFALYEIK